MTFVLSPGKDRKIGKSVVFSLVVTLLMAAAVSAAGPPGSRRFVPDEIIVKFRQPVAETVERQLKLKGRAEGLRLSPRLDQLNARYRTREIKPLLGDFAARHARLRALRRKRSDILTPREQRILRRVRRVGVEAKVPALDRIYRIKLAAGSSRQLGDVLQAYRSDPNVEYAELNYIVSIDAEPDDSLYSRQWALEKIEATGAWEISTGNPEVVVAVLDTGVDYGHRDLKDNIWINEVELYGAGGVDDDDNGYVDDIYGYNFIYNNSDPIDDHGHGTHCAGIIAAAGNNGLDIAGVCWNVKIMALKFLGSRQGEGTIADAVLALHYAVENGADIISNSWGSDSESELLEDAIEYANSQGAIIVAAAGNNASDEIHYPAGYNYVFSVAATNSNDDLFYLSNYGDWVDIAAPGDGILSLRAEGTSQGIPNDEHTTVLSGTSMAAPHVAGTCALLLSANPLLTERELYGILTRTADPIEPEICACEGRLNLSKAMQAVVSSQGYVRFDRDYYTVASPVSLLLADRDLVGTGLQEVTLTTREGDFETVGLTETTLARGVFAATVSVDSNEPNMQDGIVQLSHGEVIHAVYWDVNDGAGRFRAATDDAEADYEPPSVLDVLVGARSPAATIQVVTNEPTRAKIRAGQVCGGPYSVLKEDFATSVLHLFKLQPLPLGTDYYFVLDLVDMAGNEITVYDGNDCYSFDTPAEFPGFLVPGMYRTIQEAIDDASDGDTIWVADGKYRGDGNRDIDFRGKAITVRSENGPENCIIDCQGMGRGFHFHSSEDANSVLDGFKISAGGGDQYGGGIRCTASSPTIRNCIISACNATGYGGGMYNCYGSSPKVVNCTFTHNTSKTTCNCQGKGGGMYNCSDSHPTIINCEFIENSAQFSGGGMYNDDNSSPTITGCTFAGNYTVGAGGGMTNWTACSPIITDCTFSRNQAEDDGGAVCNQYGSNPAIINCVFSQNWAENYGGAMKNYESSPTLINCTFSSNETDWSAGGIWNGPNSTPTLTNCILWNNSDYGVTDEPAQITDTDGVSIVNYCCIQSWTGNLGGIGNTGADPLFADPNADDVHLKSAGWRWDSERLRWDYDEITSPCIDAGNPSAPLKDELLAVPDDPNGHWSINLRINMGAYGGTAEASLPPHDWAVLADMDNDGLVDWQDFLLASLSWSAAAKEHPADLSRDAVINMADLHLLAEDWLKYVRPPEVHITKPQHNEVLERANNEPVEIQAHAWDVDGPLLRVEFFSGANKIGEDTDGSDGWGISWQNYSSGVYRLTAGAIDTTGLMTSSQAVVVTIDTPR